MALADQFLHLETAFPTAAFTSGGLHPGRLGAGAGAMRFVRQRLDWDYQVTSSIQNPPQLRPRMTQGIAVE